MVKKHHEEEDEEEEDRTVKKIQLTQLHAWQSEY